MTKKHRCLRCGETKKIKKMYECNQCDEYFCKKCYVEEFTIRTRSCFDW